MTFSRPSLRLSAALAILLGGAILVTASREAFGQTLSISSVGISRLQPLRTDPVSRFKVSRSDCVAGDIITFPLIVGGYAGTDLEVWASHASDDCTSAIARTTATATCWRVFRMVPNSTLIGVPINVQDFAARPPTTEGQGVGTAASCEGTSSTAQPVTLWFMFVQGVNQIGATASWVSSIDLRGPSPPNVTSVGPGSGLLRVEWARNADPDVYGYNFFCDPLDMVTNYDAGDPRLGGGTGGSGSSVTCPDAGTGDGTEDAGDAGNDVADAATDACTPSNGGGGTGGGGGVDPTACGSADLTEGAILNMDQVARFRCGMVQGNQSTTTILSGLQNFQAYGVAVAAVDVVQNVGPLSPVSCAAPEPVDGFDELYRRAGGTAGGPSFCALASGSLLTPRLAWPALAVPVCLGLLAIRRRRLSSCRSH